MIETTEFNAWETQASYALVDELIQKRKESGLERKPFPEADSASHEPEPEEHGLKPDTLATFVDYSEPDSAVTHPSTWYEKTAVGSPALQEATIIYVHVVRNGIKTLKCKLITLHPQEVLKLLKTYRDSLSDCTAMWINSKFSVTFVID